eukprot:3461831-Amphidinium_carterae.2
MFGVRWCVESSRGVRSPARESCVSVEIAIIHGRWCSVGPGVGWIVSGAGKERDCWRQRQSRTSVLTNSVRCKVQDESARLAVDVCVIAGGGGCRWYSDESCKHVTG